MMHEGTRWCSSREQASGETLFGGVAGRDDTAATSGGQRAGLRRCAVTGKKMKYTSISVRASDGAGAVAL